MLSGPLGRALDRCHDAAFTLTAGAEIRTWNPAAEALFGYSAAEVIHRHLDDVLDPRGGLGKLVDASYCARAVHDGRVMTTDVHVKTRGRRRIWIRLSGFVIEADHASPAIIVNLAHDITAEKRMVRLTSRFAEMARRIVLERGGDARCIPTPPLSDRETRILRALARGKSPTAVARAMGISGQTLRNHLHRVNQKLGTHNRLEAVVHASRRKLL